MVGNTDRCSSVYRGGDCDPDSLEAVLSTVVDKNERPSDLRDRIRTRIGEWRMRQNEPNQTRFWGERSR